MKLSRNCRRRAALAGLLGFALSVALPSSGRAATADGATQADARLGYDTYALANAFSTPNVLFSDAGQRFADATFAEIEAHANAPVRARFLLVREVLRPNAAFDPADAGRSYLTANRDIVATLGAASFGAYELGSYAATVGFNARVMREDATDRAFRHALGSLGVLDAMVPGLAAARAKVAADDADDWDAIASDADAVARLATGAPLPSLRPAASDVWALLLRGRSIDADGPRKGSLHMSIDIVRGDGTHESLGAYPNGRDDFSVTRGSLQCETNLEPAARPSRAYALVAPKNVTYEALARRFLDACASFDKKRPRFTYVPADERASNDNAFVTGLLDAESIAIPRGF